MHSIAGIYAKKLKSNVDSVFLTANFLSKLMKYLKWFCSLYLTIILLGRVVVNQ